MKKKYLTMGIVAFALVVAIGGNIKSSMNTDSQLSALTKANVEALAGDESGNGTGCLWKEDTCPRTSIWQSPQRREECLTDGDGHSCSCGSVTRSC